MWTIFGQIKLTNTREISFKSWFAAFSITPNSSWSNLQGEGGCRDIGKLFPNRKGLQRIIVRLHTTINLLTHGKSIDKNNFEISIASIESRLCEINNSRHEWHVHQWRQPLLSVKIMHYSKIYNWSTWLQYIPQFSYSKLVSDIFWLNKKKWM